MVETVRIQTSSTGISRRSVRGHSGFTLIELIVALAIVIIMSGIALLSMGPMLRDAKMRSSCRIVASMLNYARSRAAATNSTVRVVFNQDRSIEVDIANDDPTSADAFRQLTTPAGKHRNLTDGVAITRIVKANGVEDEAWVEFSKLGQADQTVIQLTDNSGQNRYVIVDPITGRCRVEMNVDDAAFTVQTAK